MASTTPNIGLTLPTGAEKVSRQVINDNNTIIDGKMGAVPVGQNLQGEIDALNSNIANLDKVGGMTFMNVRLNADANKTFTFSGATRTLAIFCSGDATCTGIATFFVTGTGTSGVAKDADALSGITFTNETNIIKANPSTLTFVLIIVMNGEIPTVS